MSIPQEGQAIQLFDLQGLKTELGISPLEDPTHNDIVAQFTETRGKMSQDLQQGLCAWISGAENDLGHCASYNRQESTKFVVLKTIINGVPVRTQLTGNYSLWTRT